MPLWWKSSSKESKRNPNKESFIDALQRKIRFPSEGKPSRKSGAPLRQYSDIVSDRISMSRAESRCPSPSKEVARCQSFVDRPVAQPLPLPGVHLTTVSHIESGILISQRRMDKSSKKSSLVLRARIGCIRSKRDPIELDGDLITASVSSECSVDSEDPPDLLQRSPLPSDCAVHTKVTLTSPTSMAAKDQTSAQETRSGDAMKPGNQVLHLSSRRRPLSNRVPKIQVPGHGTFCNAPDSSMSSPSKSPMRVFNYEQVLNTTPLNGKPYRDTQLLGSGQCSSPGSGQNSGHNSVGGDMSGQIFLQPSRSSPEYSPVPSPRMTSPGPSSRIHSGAVTPLHPRAGGSAGDDGKQQQSHWLPLPPITAGHSFPFSNSNSAAMSPSVPRSPGKAENPITAVPHWKKGKLLGRGTFGHVYVGFSSQSGGMCAMKEVTLFADDAKSKESAKQFEQEIILLSRLKHPNIVQYYGSETVDDKLYIYLEYVSGGSIYKLLQEYGRFGESAIRSYTKQILSGLAYLHSKNTVHRDIKGANILVDPNGHVKLADFGMAKHISGQSCPLSFKGSPYWMAPEVINNSNGCHLAVDIWSLGCTVLEMATTKPPWSQYEGVAAMFKIGNSKELPAIPEHLSNEGKEFVSICLQRDPLKRPTASELLGHPFVKYLEKTNRTPKLFDQPFELTNEPKYVSAGQGRSMWTSDSERLVNHSSNASKCVYQSSDMNSRMNVSSPVSPIGSPLLPSRSLQHMSGKISAISSPHTKSGSSSPLTAADFGVIPLHLHNKSVYFQNGFAPNPSQTALYHNAAVSPNHEIFKGVQPGTPTSPFHQLLSSDRQTNARFLEGEVCNSQSALADRVSRQLLRDHVKLGPSLDLSPKKRS